MIDAVGGNALAPAEHQLSVGSQTIRYVRRQVSRFKHDVRVWLAVKRLTRQWRSEALKLAAPCGRGAVRRVVILPTDPFTLIGSKGDEAMIQGVVQSLTSAEPGLKVAIVTGAMEAVAAAQQMGFEAMPIWGERWELGKFVDDLAEFRPDALVVIGADVMDGYYSPNTALRLLASADVMARRGVRTTITGFSFNSSPSPHLKDVFDNACGSLQINVRDGPSLERFRLFSSAPANLVADVAFALHPDAESQRVAGIAAWVAKRRVAGDQILGFNIHPMLIPDGNPAGIGRLVDAAAHALQRLVQDRPVSVLLLSHDSRGSVGDDVCLAPLHEALSAQMADRIAYPRDRLSAAELKAMAGLADGVFTGRMHLAIASLGMGVPVAALTYQDKFQGLFDHFHLPDSLLIAPQAAMDAGRLAAVLDAFVAGLPGYRASVAQALPAVMRSVEGNFSGLTAGGTLTDSSETHT
jgi:polysaccharide pyruvyl transferase WcaK-like protein